MDECLFSVHYNVPCALSPPLFCLFPICIDYCALGLGVPLQWGATHMHWHYAAYATYGLIDETGRDAGVGFTPSTSAQSVNGQKTGVRGGRQWGTVGEGAVGRQVGGAWVGASHAWLCWVFPVGCRLPSPPPTSYYSWRHARPSRGWTSAKHATDKRRAHRPLGRRWLGNCGDSLPPAFFPPT